MSRTEPLSPSRTVATRPMPGEKRTTAGWSSANRAFASSGRLNVCATAREQSSAICSSASGPTRGRDSVVKGSWFSEVRGTSATVAPGSIHMSVDVPGARTHDPR